MDFSRSFTLELKLKKRMVKLFCKYKYVVFWLNKSCSWLFRECILDFNTFFKSVGIYSLFSVIKTC